MLRSAWRGYLRLLETHPVKTQVTSTVVIFGLGDLGAQTFEKQQAATGGSHTTQSSPTAVTAVTEPASAVAEPCRDPGFDFKRMGIQMGFAGFVWGPFGHYWYGWLHKTVSKVATSGTARFTATSLAFEMAICHPVALGLFFTCIGFANGQSPAEIKTQLQADYARTLACEWTFWYSCLHCPSVLRANTTRTCTA
jgi:protein Mpv17